MTEPKGMTTGSLVDSWGIDLSLDEGVLPVGGVVIIKTVDPDGTVGLKASWSDGISWMEKLGMLRYAEKYESKWIDDDDDDC